MKQLNEDNDIKYSEDSSYYWMQYKKAQDIVKPNIVCRLWELNISRQSECKSLGFNDETISTAELTCLRHINDCENNELCL